jgi:hypothetical protein
MPMPRALFPRLREADGAARGCPTGPPTTEDLSLRPWRRTSAALLRLRRNG